MAVLTVRNVPDEIRAASTNFKAALLVLYSLNFYPCKRRRRRFIPAMNASMSRPGTAKPEVSQPQPPSSSV